MPNDALPPLLAATRMVVRLPDRPLARLVGAFEVMVQEGVKVFSLPATRVDELAGLARVFGPRACFCVHDVGDGEQVEQALADGARLVSLRVPDPGLVQRCREAGVPVAVTALTPTEVNQAWALGPDAVVVAPAEVMGASYPEALAMLCPGAVLMARGGLGAYAARRWVEAGAAAVWLDDALLGDAVPPVGSETVTGRLSGLRERCQTFRAAIAE